jgi:predicted 2-oxoglutarate/Fe(II)-dependent dioxygenase YbiX
MEATQTSAILKSPEFASPAHCTSVIEAFKQVAASNNANGIRQALNRIEIQGRTFSQMGFQDIHDFLSETRTRALEAVDEFYKPNQRLFIEFTLLSEMHPGDAHVLHSDSETQDATGRWLPNHTAWREFSMMVYLNTSGADYRGGVLRFPALGEQIIPKAGLLVGFPCGRTHQHEVTPIETGLRYSVSIWTTAERGRAERW